jgi:uncharacterized protein (TIGR03437 family)
VTTNRGIRGKMVSRKLWLRQTVISCAVGAVAFLIPLGQLMAQNTPTVPVQTSLTIDSPLKSITAGDSLVITGQVLQIPNSTGRVPDGIVRLSIAEEVSATTIGAPISADLGEIATDQFGRFSVSTTLGQIGIFKVSGRYVPLSPDDGRPVGPTVQGNSVLVSVFPKNQYSINLLASRNVAFRGDTLSFTANLLPLSEITPSPVGQVAFTINGAIAQIVPLTGNSATWSTNGLNDGEFEIGAQFIGDPPSVYGISFAKTAVTIGLGGVLGYLPRSMAFVVPNSLSPQEFSVRSAREFSFTVQKSGNTPWLTVTPDAGTTPASIRVAVDPNSLSPGTYTGEVTVDAGALGRRSIQVHLFIPVTPGFLPGPRQLEFEHYQFGDVPSAKPLYLTSTSTMSEVILSTDTPWLDLDSRAGTLPGNFPVRVKVQNLVPGTYLGSVKVRSAVGSIPETSVPVRLNVWAPNRPAFSATGILHGARLDNSGIGPNTAMTIRGDFLGTGGTTKVFLNERQVSTTSVQPTQLSFVSPSFLNGYPSVKLEVEVMGNRSTPITLPVRALSPGIFTVGNSGRGIAAAVNQDGRSNGPSNPTAAGTVVAFFVTGFGIPGPQGNSGPNRLVVPVTAKIGNLNAVVEYAGQAPGLNESVQQVNVRIPVGAGSGLVPVILTAAGIETQAGVTISLR